MPDPVELTDLDVITRWSLAVRSATAERNDLIAVLKSDLAWLEAGSRTPRRSAKSVPKPAGKAAPAKRPAAKKSTRSR